MLSDSRRLYMGPQPQQREPFVPPKPSDNDAPVPSDGAPEPFGDLDDGDDDNWDEEDTTEE